MTKPRLARAFMAIITLLTLAKPTQAADAPNDEVILKRLVGFLKREKEQPVWPGYDLTTQTLVYGIGDTYYLLSTPASASARFEGQALPSLPGVKRLAIQTVQCLDLATDNVWDEKQVDNERVFVVKQMSEAKTGETLDPIHEFLTFLHENFHCTVQESFRHRMAKGDERILDAQDFAYTQLEAFLLAHLVEETDPRKLKEGVRLYLAVRETHERHIPKSYAAYRQGMMVIEGTAQYLTDAFCARNQLPLASNHIAYSRPRLKTALLKTQEADRSRYYVMGAAVCHLLNNLMPLWKERFSSYVASLDELLAEAVDYSHHPDETIRQLGKAYGIDQALSRFTAQYEAITGKEAKELEQLMKAFRHQGATRLSLSMPRKQVSMHGSWAESWDVPDHRRLTRAKLFEYSNSETRQPVLSLVNTIAIRRSTADSEEVEIYRNLKSSEIRVNGKALATDTERGCIEITQDGFALRAQDATIKREPAGFLIDVIKP